MLSYLFFFIFTWEALPHIGLLHIILSITYLRICREYWPWDFAAGIYHGYLARGFAIGICRENLSWFFGICKQILFRICEQILFIWKQIFFIREIFFINSVSFAIVAAVMDHCINELELAKEKKSTFYNISQYIYFTYQKHFFIHFFCLLLKLLETFSASLKSCYENL